MIELPILNQSKKIMHPLVNIALTAAKEAGHIINKYSQQLDRVTVNEKSQNDFVTV